MKTCKDCGKSKPDIEFRKWSRQCGDCLHVVQKQYYDSNVRPHTVKAMRDTTPTPARKRAKADYAVLMQERLGFVPVECEWLAGGIKRMRCALFDMCRELEHSGDETFCEIGDDEAGIVPNKPTGMPEPYGDTRRNVELWTDAPAHSALSELQREYTDKAGFFGGEW